MFRLFLAVAAISALLGAIIYSQLRSVPDHVSGMLEADEIRLGSRVGGRVRTVETTEGDRVVAGQPLLTLEPYDLDEREKVAAADLASRQAELKKMQAGFRQEEIAQAEEHYKQLQAQYELVKAGPRAEEIAAAEQRVFAANAQQALAQQNYDRLSRLRQENSTSQAEYDLADQRWKAANAELAVRENELAILRAGARAEELARAEASAEEARIAWDLARSGYRAEEIDAASAAVEAATAALAVIRQQKKELTIAAPSSGVVDALDLQPGDLVAPGAPVLTLLALDQLWVRAYVPQRLLKIRVGQNLRVTVDAIPDKSFAGEVTFIAGQAEFSPSNVQTTDERAKQVYRIRVALPNDPDLKPGMTADVWLEAADKK